MKKIIVALLGIILISCTNSSKQNDDKLQDKQKAEISIVTTTNLLADLVTNLAPTNFKVQSLMRAGVDPHYYKASQGDLVLLQKADIIIFNGLHLEGKMGEVLKQLAKRKTVIDASKGISPEKIRKTGEFASGVDPHYWFDVSIWSQVGQFLSEKLIENYPIKKDIITSNTEKYLSKLKALELEVINKISTLKEEERTLLTAHDAFAYFGRKYKINVLALQGLSTSTEFGIKDIQNTVNTIIDKDIKAVFVESSVSPKAMESVVQQCLMKNHKVKIGGELFSDSLGEKGTEEGTYIGMMKHNLNTFIKSIK